MIFSKAIVGNSRLAAEQFNEIQLHRQAYHRNEMLVGESMAGMMAANGLQMVGNEGVIPRDVYQEFDNQTVTRFRSDDGDTFLNDLLPLSRSINIGKMVSSFRRASDAGQTQTSMSGQIGVNLDQVEYNYDGTIVPIHDNGFGRNWREWNAQSSEGFDALIDDQRESVAAVRRRAADTFLDGHKDRDGNFITMADSNGNSLSWQGMRNDSRVAQVNLGVSGINFDFTDPTKTFPEILAAFKQVRDILYITNNCEKDAMYYVSRQIMTNLERVGTDFSQQSADGNASPQAVINRLAALMGVAGVKVSSKLVGNEMMAFPLDTDSVRPLVGMGVNTIAMPRPLYNSNYNFVTWAAIGWRVTTDYFNQKCALFAHDLG